MGINRRVHNRLQDWDYSTPWWYYVTVCTQDKVDWFGKIENGEMVLNQLGMIVQECWTDIPSHFPGTILDEFILMPNHIHGIVIINNPVGVADLRPLQKDNRDKMKLSKVIHGFKSTVSRDFRKKFNSKQVIWQRSFYDHIIRSEIALEKIRDYIRNNPLHWELDRSAEDELEL